MALVLTLLAIVPLQRSAVAHPQTAGVKGAAALGRLESLPLQAQSVISGALGAGAAAFAAEPRPGGYGLAGGGVAAHLNGREVAVHVSGGTLSLALSGVGRGARLAAAGRASAVAHANRVTYRRAGVREWYAAGPLGIEQGFTLTRRPAGTTGPVTLALSLGGSLRAQLVGAQVRFLASSGGLQARYGGLTAVDASGRRLPATLALRGHRLLLRVTDGGARYPLRIDPLIQQGPKLAPTDGTSNGQFGYGVALSADGSTALIGSSGVGAWVFTSAGGIWTQQGPKLTANDQTGQSGFGASVALSADGNTALIGGYLDNGVGAAWVFTRAGTTWTQQGPKLTPNDETSGTFGIAFGSSVALSADGNTALMGGPWDNNSNYPPLGAVWVFTRAGATWTQQGPKLTPNDETGSAEAGGARLGSSVALSADGNTAVIGGSGDNDFVGAVWVFTRSGTTWTQQGPKLTPNDETGTRSVFGDSVAVSADGDTALIGGPFDNSGAGAAWAFTRSGATWTQQGPKLIANDGTSYRYFGNSVAVSADGNTALIGGPFDNNYGGAAWAFTRAGATWTQQGPKLTASDETGQGQFGYSVAVSADGRTTLIGGNRDNNYGGAAWAFSPLLVGSQQIQANVDSNPAGIAEAFRYTAVGTESAGQLSVYLDSTSTATNVIVGLYTTTSAGNPGVLLTSGTITNPKAGAWNTVTVPATRVSAGTRYWLAVLAPFKAGTIKFRDLPDGTGGPAQTSAQKSLMSMPSSWKTGTRFANSPASLFAAP